MTQPEFTLDWPYGWQTRDSRDAVIYCTDAPGHYPIHGRIEGLIRAHSWNDCGKSVDSGVGKSSLDLINRPVPVVSVPKDKLMKGYAIIDDGLILRIHLENPQIEESRNVYFFRAEDMEVSK